MRLPGKASGDDRRAGSRARSGRRLAGAAHAACGVLLACALAGPPPAAGSLAAPLPAAAQTLDRILAVVSGHVVTASDVRAFLELGLAGVDAGDADAERRVLDHLIDRRLVLDEADRLLVGDPSPPRIEAALADLAARFPDRAAFLDLLAGTGLTLDDVRQILRDEERREAYLRSRFGEPEPGERELRRYYADRAGELGADGGPTSFEEARAAIRSRLRAARREAIEEWVAGLERRAPIVRFDR